MTPQAYFGLGFAYGAVLVRLSWWLYERQERRDRRRR